MKNKFQEYFLKIIKDFKKDNNTKMNSKTKIEFFENLWNLIESWIPITNALSIMLYQAKDKNLKKILQTFIKDLSKWKKLQESIALFPKTFNQFDIYMIKMWELTWKLGNSINIIKKREEDNKELKSKIIWALIYPSIIIFLSIVMIIGFMLFVIPRIQNMYRDAKVNLPDLTQKVIDLSNFIWNNIFFIIIVFIVIVIWIITFKNHPKTKIYADEIIIKMPLFWPLIKKKTLSIFCSTIWTLLKWWVMINESLEIAKKSIENNYYEKRVDDIIKELNEWIPLSSLMWINLLKEWKEDKFFPIEVASIVKIWEQTWKLPDLLINISNKFNKEIDSIVKNISTSIEPIVIIVVWVIIWTLIMAILLPFFNMVSVI